MIDLLYKIEEGKGYKKLPHGWTGRFNLFDLIFRLLISTVIFFLHSIKGMLERGLKGVLV